MINNLWAFAVAVLLVVAGLFIFFASNMSESLWALPGMFLGAAIIAWGFWKFREARKRLAKTADEVRTEDTRAPVIYLRSFDHEEDDARLGRAMLGGFTRALPGLHGWQQREQEEFAGFINKLVGPYIAIGRPGEPLPESGAAREYVSDDDWQATVSARLRESQMVVVRAAASEGLRWELVHLYQNYSALRILIVLPKTRARYEAFRDWAGTVFPHPLPEKLPNSRLLTFDAQWHPVGLEAKENLVETLYPFFAANGIPFPKFSWQLSTWEAEQRQARSGSKAS